MGDALILSLTTGWLLLYQERVVGCEPAITRATRRNGEGVPCRHTAALHELEGDWIICGLRQQLSLHDHKALERLTAETYGQAEPAYSRLISGSSQGGRSPAVYSLVS